MRINTINTNFYNTGFSHLQNIKKYSSPSFSGVKAENDDGRLLSVIFGVKKEAYNIIADTKDLDITVSFNDGIYKVTIADKASLEDGEPVILKEIETPNPKSPKFIKTLSRCILLANAYDNVRAGGCSI